MSIPTSPLLEREEELRALEGALASAIAGEGRVALVYGEAGIGKTSVVRAFTRLAGDVARTLWGACDPLFTPRPLGPFHDIVHGAGSPTLAALDPERDRIELFAALLAELGARPTIAVVEDAHWADEASLDALCYLVRRVDRVPCLLLVTYRDDEVGAQHPLRRLLGAIPSAVATRIELAPLSEAAVAELAAEAERDATGLYELTGGNPFFLTEVLAAGGDGVPATVRDAVLTRALGLGVEAREVLDLASVVPGAIERWLLDAVLGHASAAANECVERGMLVPNPTGLSFRHELARQAVLDAVDPERQAAYHRAVLRALEAQEDRDALLSRLAHHAEGAHDREAVLRAAPAAAKRAASVGAHREAAAQYARALRFADAIPLEDRVRLLERHSYECYLTAQDGPALESIDAALLCYRQLGDDRGLGATLRWRSLALLNWGRTAESEQAAREAVSVLERLPPSPQLAMAYNARASLASLDEDFDAAVAWAHRALELADVVDSVEARVTALGTLGLAHGMRGLQDGRALLEEALALARSHGLESHAGRTYVFLGMAASRERSLAQMRKHVVAGLDFCEERDLDVWDDILLAMRGWLELEEGAWDAAAATVAQVHARNCILSSTQANVVLGLLRARRGDPDPWAPLTAAAEVAERTGQLWWLSQVAAARAEAAWLEERPELIPGLTDAAFAHARERGAAWPMAELAHWRRHAGIAPDLPDDLTGPFAAQAHGDWTSAVEQWRAAGCPYEAALALAEGDECAQLLSLEELNRLGAAPAAGVVARRLRARGVRGVPRGPRPATRESPAGLTQRETDVLHLLAEGLRNAEIAERLVASRRTIDHHVSAILRKLGARTRGEAVAEAQRLGIQDR